MISNKKILAIIPARGGSKGVPRKNIRNLGDKPLIAHSILEAKKSKYIDLLAVSTEDEEISRVSKEYGCKVIPRPQELAGDSAPISKGLIDAVEQAKKEGFETDIIILLQPTTPFRKVEDIDKAIELFDKEQADSVVSVCEAPNKFNPHWVRKIKDGLLEPYLEEDKAHPHLMRQELPKVYWRNGQIYIVKKDILFSTQNLYGKTCVPYIMPRGNHVNIDEENDFLLAELLIEKGIEK